MTLSRSTEAAQTLVLGAGGFVGIHVVDALRAAGHHVVGTHRGRAMPFYLRGRLDGVARADLNDPDSLRAAMAGREVVFHAAGHYPRYSLDRDAAVKTALGEMNNLLDAARACGVRRVVYTSSIAVLNPRADAPRGRGLGRPRGPRRLGLSRRQITHMERAVQNARREGLDVVILRPGGCLGGWDMRAGTGGIVVAVIRSMMAWRVDGHVHMVDARDIAAAHVAALAAPRSSTYNLAGHGVSVGWFLGHIAARYGGSIPDEVLGPDEARARADAEEHAAAQKRGRVAIPREMVDIALSGGPISDARARSALGFAPRPLDEALDEAVAWFRRTGHLPPESPQNASVPSKSIPSTQ